MSQHSSRGARWERLKVAVWERDNWTCAAHGGPIERQHPNPRRDATVDHVVPKARGGVDEMSNLVAMCRKCNGEKQDKTAIRIDYYSPNWFPERSAA